MTATHLSGPLQVGSRATGETLGSTQGYVLVGQSVNLTQNGIGTVSSTIYVPTGSRIVDIIVDVLTVFNSATTATLSVGTAAAGTQYASGVDVKTSAIRIRPTFTAAQLAAMSGQSIVGAAAAIASPGTVTVSIVTVGATTTGYATVNIVYEQLV